MFHGKSSSKLQQSSSSEPRHCKPLTLSKFDMCLKKKIHPITPNWGFFGQTSKGKVYANNYRKFDSKNSKGASNTYQQFILHTIITPLSALSKSSVHEIEQVAQYKQAACSSELKYREIIMKPCWNFWLEHEDLGNICREWRE